MTITPEAKHHWELALSLARIALSLGILIPLALLMWKKRTTLTRLESYDYRFLFGLGILVVALLYDEGGSLLNRIPLRVPPPHIATPQETAAAADAAQNLRLAKRRTLKWGDAVRIVWGRGASGVVASGGGAAHQIFRIGATEGTDPAIRREDAGSVYRIAGGTQALFENYDTGFTDRDIACVRLVEGPHFPQIVWVPAERLRKQAAPPAGGQEDPTVPSL